MTRLTTIELGQRFGRLVVVDLGQRDKTVYWDAVCCDCGIKKVVRRSDLQSGRTRSCGCLRKEQARTRFQVHSSEYKGKQFGLSEIAEMAGLSYGRIYQLIIKKQVSVEGILRRNNNLK